MSTEAVGRDLSEALASVEIRGMTHKPKGRRVTRTSGTGAACGCAVAGAGAIAVGAADHVGPGGAAVGVDSAIKAGNLKHLRRIEGQVRGIAAMVAEDRYCADIITQVAAVRESLHSVARNLMRNHLKHCAPGALHRDGKGRDEMVDELLELVAKLAR